MRWKRALARDGRQEPESVKKPINELKASDIFVQRLLLSELTRTVLVSVRFSISCWVRAWGRRVSNLMSCTCRLAPKVTWRGIWILGERLLGPQVRGLPGGLAEPPFPVRGSRVAVKACGVLPGRAGGCFRRGPQPGVLSPRGRDHPHWATDTHSVPDAWHSLRTQGWYSSLGESVPLLLCPVLLQAPLAALIHGGSAWLPAARVRGLPREAGQGGEPVQSCGPKHL